MTHNVSRQEYIFWKIWPENQFLIGASVAFLIVHLSNTIMLNRLYELSNFISSRISTHLRSLLAHSLHSSPHSQQNRPGHHRRMYQSDQEVPFPPRKTPELPLSFLIGYIRPFKRQVDPKL